MCQFPRPSYPVIFSRPLSDPCLHLSRALHRTHSRNMLGHPPSSLLLLPERNAIPFRQCTPSHPVKTGHETLETKQKTLNSDVSPLAQSLNLDLVHDSILFGVPAGKKSIHQSACKNQGLVRKRPALAAGRLEFARTYITSLRDAIWPSAAEASAWWKLSSPPIRPLTASSSGWRSALSCWKMAVFIS